METLLRIQNLNKHFGHLHAVKNLSIDIQKGNVYGLLGPNGSGKSTTLGIVLNVVNKTSGEFTWFEGKVETHEALKRVGAIIERPNFYPYMSAQKNLELVCKIKNIGYDRILPTLELVGLSDRKDSLFRTFSLGMKQRLAIGSALLNNPEILILDEPTNGLDPQGIIQIRELITKISQMGTTIILASHLLDEVEKVCSHVMVLRKGEVLYSGPVDRMSNRKGQLFIGSDNKNQLIQCLQAHPDFEKAIWDGNLFQIDLLREVSPQDMNRYLVQNGIYASHLEYRKPSLEAQFLDLTN